MNHESVSATSSHVEFGSAFAAPTYYDILNVDKVASKFAIRESFLRLKNLYSTGGDGLYGLAGADDLNRYLKELEDAFAVLSDDSRRAAYDRELNNPAGETGTLPEGVDEGRSVAGRSSPVLSSVHDVIQTSRSTLRVTRIQANGATEQKLQDKMLGVIDDSDIGDGSVLISLREVAGVSQQEIQERTKIALEYIRNLEGNQFDRLPRVVYVKGFLRSYLRYLNAPKLDAIVSSYVARVEAYQAGHK